MNPMAEELNEMIKKNNPNVLSMLSKKGKEIFFPKKGILAQSAEAKGKKINATIGIALEDDGTPLALDTVTKLVELPKGDVVNYAPSYGNAELRKQWQNMMFEKNPSLGGKKISLPVVTNALTHGLSMCGYMFLDEDDELIIPEPYWGNYKLIFNNGYGAKIVGFPVFEGEGYNTEALSKTLMAGGKKKVLLLNNPNNPTGYTPLDNEIPKIVGAIKDAADKGKKIVVIIDDAYFGLVYEDGVYRESLFTNLCDLSENVLAVKLDGATKEDYVWGLRVGFLTYAIKGGDEFIYKALEDKTAGAVRGNISNAPNISQSIVLKSFTDPDYKEQKEKKYETLRKRAVKVRKIIDEHPEYTEYFKALPFNSGYFMCIKLVDGLDAEEVRQLLLKKYDTGVIAMPPLLRVAFSATPFKLLEELFDNIFNACKLLKE